MAAQQTKQKHHKYKRVADYLQRQRRNKRLSVRKVAQLTHLPDSTIRALENPNRSALPKSNITGLYRAYGEALDVTPRRLTDLLGEQSEQMHKLEVSKPPRLRSMVVLSNLGTRLVVAAVLLVIASYASWQAFGLISAPSLNVTSPEVSNVITNEASITVEGTSRPETTILVNGQPVVIDLGQNNFSQVVYLQEGFNRITVEAVNNFSRSTAREFNVTYIPDES